MTLSVEGGDTPLLKAKQNQVNMKDTGQPALPF